MPRFCRSLFLGIVCLSSWLVANTAFAQRELKDIPDPDPEIERKSFIVADGFEANLFAADPLLHKPIQMNFNPQGGLWIAASEVYPQIAPGQKANEKFLVLEDTLDASGRQIPALSEALTKAGGLTSGPRELSADELKALVAEVAEKGNAHRGEAIYRRKELNCLKCHAIGGAGGRVGPDMLSLGSSAQIDYIAESLLAPDKKVKENFNSLVVVTDDGKVRSGIKLRQTDTPPSADCSATPKTTSSRSP